MRGRRCYRLCTSRKLTARSPICRQCGASLPTLSSAVDGAGATHEIAAEAQLASGSVFSLEKGVIFRALVWLVIVIYRIYSTKSLLHAIFTDFNRGQVTVIQPKLASEISCVAPGTVLGTAR